MAGISLRGLVRCLLMAEDGAKVIDRWKRILDHKPQDIVEHRARASRHYVELCEKAREGVVT